MGFWDDGWQRRWVQDLSTRHRWREVLLCEPGLHARTVSLILVAANVKLCCFVNVNVAYKPPMGVQYSIHLGMCL